MIAFAIIQALILTVVVGFSAWQAWRKLMPRSSKRVLGRLTASLEQPRRGPVAHRLARWLQPSEAKSGDCGSGDGCSACGGCASAAASPSPAAPPSEAMPLEFKRRSK
jgi:uncharacterized protein DUF6587